MPSWPTFGAGSSSEDLVVLSDNYDFEAFGNQEVMLTRPIAVRLVRDRGQWWVDVLGADGRWSGIQRWRDALRENGPQLLLRCDQADILRALLDGWRRAPRFDVLDRTGASADGSANVDRQELIRRNEFFPTRFDCRRADGRAR